MLGYIRINIGSIIYKISSKLKVMKLKFISLRYLDINIVDLILFKFRDLNLLSSKDIKIMAYESVFKNGKWLNHDFGDNFKSKLSFNNYYLNLKKELGGNSKL